MIITEITLLRHPKLAKRLTPLIKHNGPLLQLTESESKKVSALKREAVILNTEICDLFRALAFTCDKFVREDISNLISAKSQTVKSIENTIRKVKVKRYNAQKAEMGL